MPFLYSIFYFKVKTARKMLQKKVKYAIEQKVCVDLNRKTTREEIGEGRRHVKH